MSDQAVIRTDLARERDEQRRWRLRPEHAGLTIFDDLMRNEFRPAARLRAAQDAALRRLIEFAARQVPFYQDIFAARRLKPGDIKGIGDLARLPLLDKAEVRDEAGRLQPAALPAGEQVYGLFSSSGTTGRPARILHSVSSNDMFSYLAQRQYRWFRFDPTATLAFIRLAKQLPFRNKRRHLADGDTGRLERWRYVGTYFETGPWLGFNVTNPVEDQLEWLRAERPDYLSSYSESLEHLCLASGGQPPAESVRGLIAISEQLTEGMRSRIERGFAAPVHQAYGLNEIGLVAVRCAAGRYHVHAEHCIVEIVDAEGQPCAPGATGRIAVTALCNPAMPLIRYDTDDLAEAVAGPCPCGRSLPAFGALVGRYSRIAFLPEGTLARVGVVRAALETMPDDLGRNLRRFQVHQYRDERFELRLAVTAPLPPAFAARVMAAWNAGPGAAGHPLEIVEIADIPRGPGGKFQDFTSDHMPALEREPRPAARRRT